MIPANCVGFVVPPQSLQAAARFDQASTSAVAAGKIARTSRALRRDGAAIKHVAHVKDGVGQFDFSRKAC